MIKAHFENKSEMRTQHCLCKKCQMLKSSHLTIIHSEQWEDVSISYLQIWTTTRVLPLQHHSMAPHRCRYCWLVRSG